jgi:hypothetical protein
MTLGKIALILCSFAPMATQHSVKKQLFSLLSSHGTTEFSQVTISFALLLPWCHNIQYNDALICFSIAPMVP